MTEELFRSDAYLRECAAVVIAVNENRVQLDKTIFYPEGGGQPGDIGWMIRAAGSEVPIVDTQYHSSVRADSPYGRSWLSAFHRGGDPTAH